MLAELGKGGDLQLSGDGQDREQAWLSGGGAIGAGTLKDE